MIDAPAEPHCPSCETVLVHAGSICVICDDQSHYEAPIRTSPPLRFPAKVADASERENPFTRRRVS